MYLGAICLCENDRIFMAGYLAALRASPSDMIAAASWATGGLGKLVINRFQYLTITGLDIQCIRLWQRASENTVLSNVRDSRRLRNCYCSMTTSRHIHGHYETLCRHYSAKYPTIDNHIFYRP